MKIVLTAHSPISSFQTSGCSAMKLPSNSLHSALSRSTTSTPFSRSQSMPPWKVSDSPTMTLPMLDEDEWRRIQDVRKTCKLHSSVNETFKPICDLYFEITGFNETNYFAILHHRISDYGNPCKNCHKPLRTPQAVFCAACGWRPDPVEIAKSPL